MPTDIHFTVPRQYDAGLKVLLDLSEPAYTALLQALATTQPVLHREDFVRAVSKQAGMGFLDTDRVLTVLVNLYTVRANLDLPPDKVADTLVAALKEVMEDQRISAEPEQLRSFRQRLPELLDLQDTVGVVSKASFLWYQHEHVFLDAQTLTDIRPVFRRIATEPPTAAMVIHKLRISYSVSGESERRDFLVALDSEDLDLLERSIERAKQKATTLRQLLSSTPMRVLNEREQGED